MQCSISAIQVVHSFSGRLAKKNLSWVPRLSPLMQSPADIEACHNFSGDLAPASTLLAPPPPTCHPPIHQPLDFPHLGTSCQSARPRWPQYGTWVSMASIWHMRTLWAICTAICINCVGKRYIWYIQLSTFCSLSWTFSFWHAKSVYLTPPQKAPCSLAAAWSQLSIGSKSCSRSKLSVSPPSMILPFCCCSLCLLLTSKVAPLNIANCHWSNTETVIKSNNRPPPSLSSHIPKMWIPAIFLATLFPFCMLGFLLTSKAPLTVPTLIQVSLLKSSNACQTRLKQRPISVKNGVF